MQKDIVMSIAMVKMKNIKHQKPMHNPHVDYKRLLNEVEPVTPLSDKEKFLKKHGKNMVDREVRK